MKGYALKKYIPEVQLRKRTKKIRWGTGTETAGKKGKPKKTIKTRSYSKKKKIEIEGHSAEFKESAAKAKELRRIEYERILTNRILKRIKKKELEEATEIEKENTKREAIEKKQEQFEKAAHKKAFETPIFLPIVDKPKTTKEIEITNEAIEWLIKTKELDKDWTIKEIKERRFLPAIKGTDDGKIPEEEILQKSAINYRKTYIVNKLTNENILIKLKTWITDKYHDQEIDIFASAKEQMELENKNAFVINKANWLDIIQMFKKPFKDPHKEIDPP